MAKLSRRKFIAGAAAAPIASVGPVNGATSAQPAANASKPWLATVKADPVVARVRAWMAEHDAREVLMMNWQDWENALCDKIRPLGMGLTQGVRSRLPEAKMMRAIDRQIKASTKRLDREAGRIVLMAPTTPAGALAKIEMGVKLQGPYDWNDDYVYALVRDGMEQLARLL